MASLNHGSIIGSIFGKGTVYENLDEEEEGGGGGGGGGGRHEVMMNQGRGRILSNNRLVGSSMNSESEDSDEDPSDDILTERERPGTSSRTRMVKDSVLEEEEEEDEPQNLMIERRSPSDKNKLKFLSPKRPLSRSSSHPRRTTSLKEQSGTGNYQYSRNQQLQSSVLPLYKNDVENNRSGWTAGRTANNLMIDPKEKARWKWANVQNLDIFLQEVSNSERSEEQRVRAEPGRRRQN